MSTDTETVDLVGDETVVNVARTALFAAMMGAFAYVTFPNPVSPAPITLQMLGVFLAGIMLGPLWGGAALVLYLAAGAVGAPVFSGGAAGIGHLLGAQAGYLWGFPVAAVVVGLLVHGGFTLRDPQAVGLPRLVGAMVAGTAVDYALGIVGLMLVLGLGPWAAFLAGAAAFLPAEALKIAATVAIVRADDIAAR